LIHSQFRTASPLLIVTAIMPRRSLSQGKDVVFHVLNRGANKSRIFCDNTDYSVFEKTLAEAISRTSMRLLAYCLMPNHWHLVLRPCADELPGFMHWLCLTHAMRWRVRHETIGIGHVYQGRYRAIPVQSDEYLLTLLRYVEANPLRAQLVARAEDWRWSSLAGRSGSTQRVPLTAWPFDFPGDWTGFVNATAPNEELSAIRNAIALNETLGVAGSTPTEADTGSPIRLRESVAGSANRLPESDLTN
jgi:putative transposase